MRFLRDRWIKGFGLGALVLLVVSCGAVLSSFGPSTQYERYVSSLRGIDDLDDHIAETWENAGSLAMSEAVSLLPPFRESLFFDARTLQAAAYRIELRRGQELVCRIDMPRAEQNPHCFVDLFTVSQTGEPDDHLAEADKSSRELRYEIPRDGTYLLRVQPEMRLQGLLHLDVVNASSLVFPVQGHDATEVASFFGDPRPGGRRHDGIDIFAPRGTPVLAATGGRVTRAGENRLGGNVVWLRGDGLSFYYAHLDKREVATGERVRAGEVVGLVGNTGNASTTPPHLHFGIYDGRPVDPLPYLSGGRAPAEVSADLERLGDLFRPRSGRVNLRQGPSTRTPVVETLEASTVLQVVGAQRDWYRVRLADGPQGYILGRLLEPAPGNLDSFLQPKPSRGAES